MLNFNSGDAGLATLGSLSGQDHHATDLIVFDNASVDGSREAIAMRFPNIPVINTGKNLGYCGGNNAALEYGLAHGYDAVIIANHDLRVGTDAVGRLVKAAREHPEAGVIGAQELDGESGKPRVLGGRGYNFWRSRRQWVRDPQALGATDEAPIRMDYVQGAFLLVTRAAIER
ncbi:MAG TPA: glycosyltransferase family 2 protein, partial [Gemmatimonadaceae bacterium]